MSAFFQNSFTVVFSKKFAIATKLVPHCPPHLRCVTSRPCETLV